MPAVEENFPRGGRKPVKRKHDEIKEKRTENLFSTTTLEPKPKKKAKKAKSDNHRALLPNDESVQVKFVDVMSHKKLQEGTLFLGVVQQISEMTVHVGLPGRISGNIFLRYISDPYLRNLNRQIDESNTAELENIELKKVFQIGQKIPVKVLLKEVTEKGTKVALSTRPNDINSEFNHNVLGKGCLLWAAVSEKSDHCYILDAGIKYCRVVLPFKAVDEGVEYVVGQPLWCSVRKSDVSKEATTITASTKHKEVFGNMAAEDTPVHRLIPGTQVEFQVEQIVKNGLSGKIFNNVRSHVHELFLKSPLESLKNYSEDTVLKARVLYVEPTTKFVKLTLRSIEEIIPPSLPIGSIQTAVIHANSGTGLSLRLGKNKKLSNQNETNEKCKTEKGFVTYKRLVNTLPKKDNENIEALLRKKYPLHSSHKCRILDYNHLEMEYICTFEASALKETVFSETDLTFGQVVHGKISKIEDKGMEIKVGHLTGFVPNFHISSSKYSENIKKKFKVGQVVKAKFFEKAKTSLRFTMKQAFLESDACLSKYQDAERNTQFPGLVVQITNNGALILFYGSVKGWLPKHLCTGGNEYSAAMFYEGQVIKTTVFKCDAGNKLTLTLNPPRPSKKERLHLGQIFDGTVVRVEADQLVLKVRPKGKTDPNEDHVNGNSKEPDTKTQKPASKEVEAILPYYHLSHDEELSKALLSTFTKGNKIHNLMVVSDVERNVVSLRVGRAFDRHKLKIPVAKRLEVNQFIYCSVERNDFSGVEVYSPLKGYNNLLRVYKEDIIDEEDEYSKCRFAPHQALIAKVEEVSYNIANTKLSTKLTDVFDFNFMHSINLLEEYLMDCEKLKSHLQKKKHPIVKYKIGQQIDCVINNINKGKKKGKQNERANDNESTKKDGITKKDQYMVTLKDGVQGLISNSNSSEDLKNGTSHKGVVLHVDYIKQILDLSLEEAVISKVDQDQTRKIGKGKVSKATLLSVKLTYAIALQKLTGRIVLMPIPLHENDLLPAYDYYEEQLGGKIDVFICKEVNGVAVGFADKIKKQLDQEHEMVKGTLKNEIDGKNEKDCKNMNKNEIVGKEGKTNKDVKADKKANKKEQDKNKQKKNKELEEQDSGVEEEEMEVDDEVSKAVDGESSDEVDVTPKLEEMEDDEDNDNEEIDDMEDDDEEEQSGSLQQSEDEFKEVIGSKGFSMMPGVSGFFDLNSSKIKEESDSSDEEPDEEGNISARKLKSNTIEKIIAEEEKTLKQEFKIADESGAIPQTPREFDAALAAEPNSSRLWVLYITSLAAAGEFEKARAKARKALDTISMEQDQERFNVWMAYLNLENSFGDRTSFDAVFEDAVVYNDALKIYLGAIESLAEAGKYVEMEEKVKRLKNKYKQNPDMYLKLAKIYFQCRKFKEARQLQSVAVKYVPDKQQHLNLLVQFAVMEFKFGEPEYGESVFETIIQTDPSRVDVWSTYIDQLTKLGKISLARKVLVRAVSNKLHMKKMAILLKKFQNFEKKHGDEETMREFKRLATDKATFM